MTTAAIDLPEFSWVRDDIEARIGVHGGRFTRVHGGVWFLAAMAFTIMFYGALSLMPMNAFVETFTLRGPVQYVTVLFTFWALAMLLVKRVKIGLQARTLDTPDLVPADPEFVLSAGTVDAVLQRIRDRCDDPSRFFLFNRLELALSNLRNMGRVADVDEVLRSQGDSDESVVESSYSLLRGLVWAIPVLGFIGTVQGLSAALGNFGGVLSETSDFQQLRPVLREVTGGLSTAFDTTFVALVAALAIQLLLTVTHRQEQDLLDNCSEYCKRNVVARLRLTPFERDAAPAAAEPRP